MLVIIPTRFYSPVLFVSALPRMSVLFKVVLLYSLCASLYAEPYDRLSENTHALANGGDAKAQLKLGDAYYMGKNGVDRSCEQAIYWFERAAGNQHEMIANMATYLLGQLYSDSTCEQYDYSQAVVWFTVAAKRGVTAAQNNLGSLYLYGQGVPQDSKQAFNWFEAAARQENASAQINLALLYLKGDGVNKNAQQAIFWLEKAARLGDAVAQARLAVLYFSGNPETQDYVLAYMWSNIAAVKSGDTKFASTIEQKMNKTDVVLAKKLIKNCLKSDYHDCDYNH